MRTVKYCFIIGMCMLHMPMIAANSLFPYDFKLANSFGDTIPYLYTQEEFNVVTVSSMQQNESWYKTDSLVIPESVIYDGQEYTVKYLSVWCFTSGPKHVRTLHLPKTFTGLDSTRLIFAEDMNAISPFVLSPFEKILVEESNPYFTTRDGVLFTKDSKKLVAYPCSKVDSVVVLDETLVEVANSAFSGNPYIKRIILPNTLKIIRGGSFTDLPSLEELVLKDSVANIEQCAFIGHCPRLVLGTGVKTVSSDFIYNPSNKVTLICNTLIPPQIIESKIISTEPNTIRFHDSINLYVPRKSLHLYQQAAGWKDCASILPIEPPIVTGLSSAEVSWVQNFSATGYIWTLYTDEAKTQRLMSLTFDTNGHLVNIDINSSHMPSRMPALSNEDDENGTEKRFAEYYTFTITGLSAETKYYYTRQSLNGTEVIDEESGSFTTQQDEHTGLKSYESGTSAPQKFIKNGQVLIRSGKQTYDVQGKNIGK